MQTRALASFLFPSLSVYTVLLHLKAGQRRKGWPRERKPNQPTRGVLRCAAWHALSSPSRAQGFRFSSPRPAETVEHSMQCQNNCFTTGFSLLPVWWGATHWWRSYLCIPPFSACRRQLLRRRSSCGTGCLGAGVSRPALHEEVPSGAGASTGKTFPARFCPAVHTVAWSVGLFLDVKYVFELSTILPLDAVIFCWELPVSPRQNFRALLLPVGVPFVQTDSAAAAAAAAAAAGGRRAEPPDVLARGAGPSSSEEAARRHSCPTALGARRAGQAAVSENHCGGVHPAHRGGSVHPAGVG